MNIKPKEKFIVKQEFNNYNINYDFDDSLIKPIFNSKGKNTEHYENINLQNNTKFYYSHQTNVAGRGFGNLDTSNDIHFSNSSRNNSQEWKQYKEGIIIDRFEYIDSNIQNPKHHVMNDIPRGGISTRKQNTTHIQNTLSRENKDFTFTY